MLFPKKVINGKMYNTATAKMVASWCHRGSYNAYYLDSLTREELYVKRTGEYFLSCEGGTSTEYSGRQILRPLSEKEAREWVDKKVYPPTKDKREEVTVGDNWALLKLIMPQQ